jgi:hypothetical protein
VRTIPAFFFLVIIPAFFSGNPLHSQTLVKNYSFSVSPLAGLFAGEAAEIVYKENNRDYLSLLQWGMKPLFYFGGAIDFSRTDALERWGFFSFLNMKFGIAGKSGTLEDRDWIGKSYLTHFSRHDNYTNKMFDIDFAAGFSFPAWGTIVFKVYGEFIYTHFSWTGKNGYGQADQISTFPEDFGPWHEDLPKYTFSGKVIDYTQDWMIFAPGFGVLWPFHRYFSLELLFPISPFVFSGDHDVHYYGQYGPFETRDVMAWGLFIEPRLLFSFTPDKKLKFSLRFAYRFIHGTKGDLYESQGIGKEAYSLAEEKAGAGLSYFDAGISAGYSF